MKVLHYRSDIRSVAFILIAIAVYAVQWAGWARHPSLYAAGLALAFIGCVINHNHQHHPTFVPRWLDRCFGVLISLANGMPATVIVAMHNFNHHVHNNHAGDYVRTSIVRFRWRWLNLLLFPLAAIAHFAPAKASAIRQWRETRQELFRQVQCERFVLYPLLVFLLVLRPIETLVYLAVPCLFGQWCILAINHVQHVGCDPDSKYNHSRNFVGRFSNWWFFNSGYHTAHHLRPSLHWSRLPAFHKEICDMLRPELKCRSLAWAIFVIYLWPRPTRRDPTAANSDYMQT